VRPPLAGLADHEPPQRCLDGRVVAEAIAVAQRLHERVMDRIAAELFVTNDRDRDPLESLSIATVDTLELLERNRAPAMSQRLRAQTIRQGPPFFYWRKRYRAKVAAPPSQCGNSRVGTFASDANVQLRKT